MAQSRDFGRFTLAAAFATVLALGGCVVESSYEQLDGVTPTGSPFSQALFKDYAALARSFGTETGKSGRAFDSDSSIAMTSYTGDTTDLANAFADKAIVAGRGEEVVVDPAPDGDTAAQLVRVRVLRDVDAARDKAPEEAARVQTDYDCWVMNGTVDSQRAAAARCQSALNGALAALESKVNVAAETAAPAQPDANANPDTSGTPPAPATAPAAPTTPVAEAPAPAPAPPSVATESAPPPAASMEANGSAYTVYFAWDSPVLTSEDIQVIQHVIADARASGQRHIIVVGHTDRSGAEDHNQSLSEHRADAVRDMMVSMGARREAIQASGVGEKDLAVNTPKGVKEPRNRRAVITLAP